MRACIYILGILLCLSTLSCGGSGKNKRREPSRRSKRNVEVYEKIQKTENVTADESATDVTRNNGNYRKPKQSRRDNSQNNGTIVQQGIKDKNPNESKIERRVELEQKLWKANENGSSTLIEQLRKEISELTKDMSQQEIDEAARRIKDAKKRLYF